LGVKLEFQEEIVMEKQAQYLPLNLQFFAEEGNEGNDANPSDATKNTEEQGVDNKGSNSAPAQEETKQPDHMIPKTRFDEINSKYKDVQSQLDELLTAKQQQEKQAKEEQGKFQELYEDTNKQLDSYKSQHEQSSERVKALESVMNDMLTAKLEAIPEDYHDIIPDGLSAEQKLAWVDRAEQKGLFGSKKFDEPLGEDTNPSQQETSDVNKLNPFQMLKNGYGRKA
jgi:ElaB/YqjD/DUF883 family membrane-anchored ribosome-binding protein